MTLKMHDPVNRKECHQNFSQTCVVLKVNTARNVVKTCCRYCFRDFLQTTDAAIISYDNSNFIKGFVLLLLSIGKHWLVWLELRIGSNATMVHRFGMAGSRS